MRKRLSVLTIIALVAAATASPTIVMLPTHAAAQNQPKAQVQQDQGQNVLHRTIPWL